MKTSEYKTQTAKVIGVWLYRIPYSDFTVLWCRRIGQTRDLPIQETVSDVIGLPDWSFYQEAHPSEDIAFNVSLRLHDMMKLCFLACVDVAARDPENSYPAIDMAFDAAARLHYHRATKNDTVLLLHKKCKTRSQTKLTFFPRFIIIIIII